MSRIGKFVLASLLVGAFCCASATTAMADTASFNFESFGTSSGGALTNLSSTVGSLTMTLTRPGSRFDISDLSFEPTAATFGTRSLSPFSDVGNTVFIANFSSGISSLSVSMGDFVPSDLDTLTMVAFDALDGTGNVVATATTICCDTGPMGTFAFTTFSVSGVGIRSVRFIGGSASFQNSVYYDNITANYTPAAVPEPASLILLGTGLIGFAKFRRRRHLDRQ